MWTSVGSKISAYIREQGDQILHRRDDDALPDRVFRSSKAELSLTAGVRCAVSATYKCETKERLEAALRIQIRPEIGRPLPSRWTPIMVAVGQAGERLIKADDFFVDLLTTALQPGEILREIRINKGNGRSGHAYQKVPHPASGFAVVGVAVNLSLADDGSCEASGIGVTGVASKAYRAAGVESALNGKHLDEQTISAAAAHASDGVDANSDLYASEEYRRHLAQVHTRRAIQAAARDLQEPESGSGRTDFPISLTVSRSYHTRCDRTCSATRHSTTAKLTWNSRHSATLPL